MRIFPLIFCLLCTPALAAPSLAGIWQGDLGAGGTTLKLQLVLQPREGGGYIGTLDSVSQGAMGLPIDAIAFDEPLLTFSMAAIGASFQGALQRDGERIDGEWKQGGQLLPLTFTRVQKGSELIRPQEPKPPFPYTVEEVSFDNSAVGIRLGGALTRPHGTQPVPCVLLITGSGAQDRNEEIFGHKPFWVIADALTRRGVAVLRVDDRGVGASEGTMAFATTSDFVSDAEAAVQYLRSRPDLDATQLFLCGHSEGAMIAAALAGRDPAIAGVILLACPAVSGAELMPEQVRRAGEAAGGSDAVVAFEVQLMHALIQILGQPVDDLGARKLIADRLAAEYAAAPESLRKSLGSLEERIEAMQSAITPWFRAFLLHDTREDLAKLKCPLLALYGSLDVQVPAEQSVPEMQRVLGAVVHRGHTIRTLISHNHLFQHARTGGIAEYGLIEETFSPEALDLIGDFLEERTR